MIKLLLSSVFIFYFFCNCCLSQQQISEFSEDSHLYIEGGQSSNELNLNYIDDSVYSKTILADRYQVNDVKISENGKTFYSCGREGVVRKWSDKGELLKSYGQTIYSLNTIALDEKNDLIYAGSGSGYLYVWNSKTGILIKDVKIHNEGTSSIMLMNGFVYSSNFDGLITKTDPNNWETEEVLNLENVEVYDILPVRNSHIIVSARKILKDDHHLGLITIDINSNKEKTKFHSIGEFDEYSVLLNNKTSLNLKPYGINKNDFTIIRADKAYFVSEKGKIEVHNVGDSTMFDEYGYVDEYLEDIITNWDYVFQGGCQYSSDGKLNHSHGMIYSLDERSRFTRLNLIESTNIPRTQVLDSIFKTIIPLDISKGLEDLRKSDDIGSDGIVPVVQNNFSSTYERVVSSDKKYIAVSNETTVIKVFNIHKSQLLSNLESKSKVIRLITHPFAPLFASLHIDGTINVWDFESSKLLKSYEYIDNEKYVKKDQKNKTHGPNHNCLTYAKKFNSRGGSTVSFEFSELGDEIRIFLERNWENQFEQFNRINILSDKSQLIQEEAFHFEELSVVDIPLDIKGYDQYISLEDFGYGSSERYLICASTEDRKRSGLESALSIWRNLDKELQYIVPSLQSSQEGNTIVLDYGSAIYSVDLTTLENSILRINDISNKYSFYTSDIEIFKPNELIIPKTSLYHSYYFKIKRNLDTTFAKTDYNPNSSSYKWSVKDIDLDEMSGSSEVGYGIRTRKYFIDEYYRWTPKLGDIKSISNDQFKQDIKKYEFEGLNEDNDEEWDEWHEKHECEGNGQWSDYLDEDYVMQSSESDESNRASYNEQSESIGIKNCSYYTTLYYNNQLLIQSMSNDKEFGFIPSQTSNIAAQEYLHEPNFLTTTNINGEIHLWDWENQPVTEPVVTMIGSGEELFVMTPDFYYMGLTKNANSIAFRKKGVLFGFEQFDLIFNRPDIILNRIGLSEQSLINAYYKAYQKRIKKMGFTEDMLKADFHLPEIKIENFEYMPTITDSSSIRLNLNIEDTKYNLDRINIWINDVAVYGANGITLRDKNIQNYQTSLDLNLVNGNNKVHVSVLNQAGAESYKESFEIECTSGKQKPDLFIITIGDSKFKDANYDLSYAAKDAQDIADLFSESKIYNKVKTKTLTNEKVTKENIINLRSFLEQADINDEVMIFVAGHGVLDEELDYFFATYDTDFNNPSERGLAYEDLEGLLDGIAPLKKTLLIDACHSGEIDKEEVELMAQETTEMGDVQFRAVGNSVAPKLGMQNTSELTKSLFTDLRKGTGATVISSAGGMEFAMESGDWQNGLFTYCLINGVKSQDADLNNDGEIWLS
jgi:hypothetical protein